MPPLPRPSDCFRLLVCARARSRAVHCDKFVNKVSDPVCRALIYTLTRRSRASSPRPIVESSTRWEREREGERASSGNRALSKRQRCNAETNRPRSRTPVAVLRSVHGRAACLACDRREDARQIKIALTRGVRARACSRIPRTAYRLPLTTYRCIRAGSTSTRHTRSRSISIHIIDVKFVVRLYYALLTRSKKETELDLVRSLAPIASRIASFEFAKFVPCNGRCAKYEIEKGCEINAFLMLALRFNSLTRYF